jgi:outer membrane immunogenic protein
MAVRTIIIAALGVIISGPTVAADLRRPAPVAAGPQVDWTGLYLGGNVGYGWNHAVVADTFSAPGFGSLGPTTYLAENLNGAIWGGQIGHNWQFRTLVLGLEADFNGSRQVFDQPYGCDVGGVPVPGCTVYPKDRIRWFGTARARAGFAVDRWLIYVTGGGAWQNLGSDGHVTIAGVGGWDVFSTSTTRFGYTVGVGAEAVVFGKWSMGVEYLFLDTGTKTTANAVLPAGLSATLGAPATTAVYETHRLTDQVVRLRLNFRPLLRE